MRALLVALALAIAVGGLVTGSVFWRQAGQTDQARSRVTVTSTDPTTVPLTPALTSSPSMTSTGASTTPALPSTQSPPAARTARPVQAPAAPPPVAQPTTAPVQQLPLPYGGSAGQVITVVGSSSTATTAQLTAWTRSGTGWTRAIGPIAVYVGSAGIGRASEGSTKTPAGVFGLTEAFGILADNGTRLPYRRVDTSDWWVSDVDSPAYNTHYRCAPGSCPFDEGAGENLGHAGSAYNHAVVIDYNRYPVVAGAGSAFFLHVSAGRATAGCVTVPAASLDALMRWLDPAKHPVIDIGVA